MLKKRLSLLGIICLLIPAIMLPALFSVPALSFFSDTQFSSLDIKTGSVNASISGFSVNDEITGQTVIPPADGNTGIILGVNAPVGFVFTVSNEGESPLSSELEISLAFDVDLPESGKLFLYPYGIDSLTILQNAADGDFTDAVIGADASDVKNIATSAGNRQGIAEKVDTALLANDAGDGRQKSYAFKLLFFYDADIAASPMSYNGIALEVGITAYTDVYGRDTAWARQYKTFFRVQTSVDITPPVITEIAGVPKTYFITQAPESLPSFVTATDDFDGDVTPYITADVSPAYDNNKAAEYGITYNVNDKAGNAALPVQVNMTVWDFVKIESGNYHTLALTSHGKVYIWGYNSVGQLGNGTTQYSAMPTLVSGLDNIIDIAAGTGSSYALAANGQLYSWGYNSDGQLGDNTITNRNKPVAVQQPSGVKFVKVSANYQTVGAITADGDVYTWGYGGYGAAGTGAGADIRVPSKIDVTDAKEISMGYYNGAVITTDGRLITWGDNLHGQLGNGRAMAVSTNAPSEVPYFTDNSIRLAGISAGWYHMAAVGENGRVYTWGYGYEGRLGNNSTSDINTPQDIGFSGAEQVYAAYYHSGIVATDGSAYFFGQNVFGKHGTGNTTNHLVPTRANIIENASFMSLALDSSFVLSAGRLVYGMGYGGTGVLGTGASSDSTSPVTWAFTPPPPS